MLIKVSVGGMKKKTKEPQTFQICIFCGSQDISFYLTDR